MNIADWLDSSARLTPDAPALMRGVEVVADYAEFARRAAALGAGLAARYAIAPGDRVAIFMKNRTEYLETLYAVLWIGAAIVPINAKLHPKEAAVILEDSAASLVVASEADGAALREIVPALNCLVPAGTAWHELIASNGSPTPLKRADDDLAWLFYTSGTTGKPKGVMLSHGNLVAASLCYPVDVDPVAQADAALYAAPMSHGAGLYNFIHVRKAARHVVPLSAGFEPDEILDLSKQLREVSFFAAPTMVRRLVERCRASGETGDGIKTIVYGGGHMYLSDIEEAVAVMGDRFVQIYGQGESPMTITALDRREVTDRQSTRWRERLQSVGRAQSCVELRVTDADGTPLPTGETGEILVGGPQVMKGYWRNPKATADTLRDGWLWTGDLGRLDEDGFLTLTDRSKDVVISGGTNIYPREVETVLLAHPAVVEASVVGRPDPEWGEVPVAFLVLADGVELDAAALDRHCNEHMARFKRPKAYHVLPDLPKNNYGKIVKTELRARLADPG
ncbi:AMP-binding protein [Mesorhizobium sp. CAU 1741]|uniref:class I adenylate-forming enzyme family protein n=1 Tax=Mesorhizobium sp. CAU 1741 TaxID=3140366 RepID=UPI00325A462E